MQAPTINNLAINKNVRNDNGGVKLKLQIAEILLLKEAYRQLRHDPFVVVDFHGHKHQTRVIYGGVKRLIWEEEFIIMVPSEMLSFLQNSNQK